MVGRRARNGDTFRSGVLRKFRAVAGACLCTAIVAVCPRVASAQTPPTVRGPRTPPQPAPAAMAAADTATLAVGAPSAWRPAPGDTVWTAMLATVPNLADARAEVRRRDAAGALVFARIRATFDRYWYELVSGPWPAVAACDSALAASPPAQSARIAAPVRDRWESARRGMVAGPSPATPQLPREPGDAAADSSGGGV